MNDLTLPPQRASSISCTGFVPYRKNTLLGFARIHIGTWRVTVHDVQIHAKNDSRWAALPSKVRLDRDGNSVRDPATGKPLYSPLIEFDTAIVRNAFSRIACDAVEAYAPGAFAEAGL